MNTIPPWDETESLPNDDQPLDELLRLADPLLDLRDYAPVARLRREWAKQSAACGKVEPPKTTHRRMNPAWLLAACVAALLVGSATVWKVVFPSSNDRGVDSQHAPIAHRESLDVADEAKGLVVARHAEDKPRRLSTVAQLLQQRSRSERVRRLGRGQRSIARPTDGAGDVLLDHDSLKRELADWLREWSKSEPWDRGELVAVWNKNREFWLAWTADWCGSFGDAGLDCAAVDVLVADQGAAAEPILWLALERPSLRKHAWSHLCQTLSDQSLEVLVTKAVSCDEMQRVGAALVARSSPAATKALARLAIQPACRLAMERLQVEWPASHANHCRAMLVSGNDQNRIMAARLLAMIPSADVDVWLKQQIESGHDRVDAISIALLRSTVASKRLVAELSNANEWAANLPSAVQQLARWDFKIRQGSFLENKVCESCAETSS